MKNKILLAIFFISIITSYSFAQTYVQKKLDNGLTLIMVPDSKKDDLAISLWVKSGLIYEPSDKYGISHFIEHLVFGTTKNHPSGSADIEIEMLGSTIDARTLKDATHYDVTINPKYMEKALESLFDITHNAEFLENEIEIEKKIVIDEILRSDSDVFQIGIDKLSEELFKSHPYSSPIEGDINTIKGICRADLTKYYKDRYTSNNITLVISGNFEENQALQKVQEIFVYEKGNDSEKKDEVPKNTHRQIKSNINNKSDAYALGFIGPKSTDLIDTCCADIIVNYVYNTIRRDIALENKYTYENKVDFINQLDNGLIYIIIKMPSIDDNFVNKINLTIESIARKGIDDRELIYAKSIAIGRLGMNNQSSENIASFFGSLAVCDCINYADDYRKAYDSITNEQIINFAKIFLNKEKSVEINITGTGAKR